MSVGCRARRGLLRWTARSSAPGCSPVVHQTIDTLSKGFKRRVGLAQAILHDPDVLILDEPTDGLDPNQKYQVRKLIADMAKEKAIVVSTHILEEVDAVCSRAVIIDRGKVVADSTAEKLKLKLPNHNAVAIRLSTSDLDKTKKALNGLETIDKVETVNEGEEVSQLRAVPVNGKSIAGDVAQCLTSNSVHPEELYVEQGSLDDVFRQITTSDTGGANA